MSSQYFVHGEAPWADLRQENHALSTALQTTQKLAGSHDHPAAVRLASVLQNEPRVLERIQRAVERVLRLPTALQPAALRRQDVRSAINAFTKPAGNDTMSVNLTEIAQILREADKTLSVVPRFDSINTRLRPLRAKDTLTAQLAWERLHLGAMIELSVTPLYLYSMYSVQPGSNEGQQVRSLLRGVLQQEMLHLALCGNILTAVGGSLTLYDPRVVPRYPMSILCSNVPMHLEALSHTSLEYFQQIEAAVPTVPYDQVGDNPAPDYSSIGQLYDDLYQRLDQLEDENFTNNVDSQFVGQNFFDVQLYAVTDRSTAHDAIVTIIEQGEGNLRVPDSHEAIFTKIDRQLSWQTYPVPADPQTEGYKGNEFIYRLSLSVDAGYCYLLQNIQLVWVTVDASTRQLLFRNMYGLMNDVITPLAELLIQQPFGIGCAAPCFNYYPMVESTAWSPLEPADLQTALVQEVNAAAAAAPTADLQLTLQRLATFISANLSPSA